MNGLLARPMSIARAPALVWLFAILLVWALYAAVFLVSADGLGGALGAALVNVAPLGLLAPGVDFLLRGRVIGRGPARQAAAHAVLAPAFAAFWYGGIVILFTLENGLARGDWTAVRFSGLGLSWQMYQGVILYAAVAGIAYARAFAAQLARQGDETDDSAPFERYLTRIGETIAPVDVAEIVSIVGAQDYAEVATLGGRHLARLSLGEFERRLDPARFIRIHRSAIVNLARLASAEPSGGGRLNLLLANGETIQTSRAGARKLRALVY
ncbi:MAG TPA: LytTR family DNA-binding domain-containing protein [Allosphingosinicella sp.]|jgi:hypothetical protein|nr:LytTR family DNA-binding domain-containing protein [Allosphingosinicella sp.]